MKLQEIKIFNSYRSLEPIPEGQLFPKLSILKGKIDPITLVGLNGSGKSNFLELLADIFFELEIYFLHKYSIYKEESPNYFAFANNKIKEPIYFEIRYKIRLRGQDYDVKVVRKEENKNEPYFYTKQAINDLFDTVEYIKLPNDIKNREYLPLVIAYTSGLNDLLTMPFIDLQDYYAQQVARQAIANNSSQEKIVSPSLLLLSYESNAAIVVSNLLLASENKRKVFRDVLKINRINSFRIIIRLNKLYGKRKVKITNELEGYIQSLVDCAALSSINFDDKKGNEYILDFNVNNVTKELFVKKFSNNPQNLFEALNKLNLLNTLCVQKAYRNELRKKRSKGQLLKFPQIASLDKIFSIEQIELVLTQPEVKTEYEKISDGEHQFIHIVGGIMLFDNQEPSRDIMYLLDEPDTHFNPFWRSTFFYQLQNILVNRDVEILLTTHSPFILSDCHGYNVFKFEKRESHVTFERVEKETYGTTFQNILDDIFQSSADDNNHFKSQIARMSFLEISSIHSQIDLIRSLGEWIELSESVQKRIKLLGESTDKTMLIKFYTDKEQSLRSQTIV